MRILCKKTRPKLEQTIIEVVQYAKLACYLTLWLVVEPTGWKNYEWTFWTDTTARTSVEMDRTLFSMSLED